MPWDIFESLLLNKITDKPTKIQTEVMPRNISFSPNFSEYWPIDPANLFPIPIAAKYIPIIDETSLCGDNLVIYDNITGEAHNSPKVWNR